MQMQSSTTVKQVVTPDSTRVKQVAIPAAAKPAPGPGVALYCLEGDHLVRITKDTCKPKPTKMPARSNLPVDGPAMEPHPEQTEAIARKIKQAFRSVWSALTTPLPESVQRSIADIKN